MFINSIICKIKPLVFANNIIIEKSIEKNIGRIYHFTIIQMVIHIFNILFFILNVKVIESNQILWRQGIIALHILMLFISIIVNLIITLYRKKEDLKKIKYIQYSYFMSILLGVVALSTIDQLVTTNITPFVIAILSLGILFYIQPINTIIIYISAYLLFYLYLPLINISHEIVSTNRVNGITIIIIGLAISFINWDNHYRDVIQKKEIAMQRKNLEELAYYDPLTGLPNRRLLDITLAKEIENIKRFKYQSCIVVVDIDYFKKINDTYGHPAGDRVLKQLANLISENIRHTDTMARLGGEEFIVLYANTKIEEGVMVSEKLRKLIMKHDFNIGENNIKVTASFGLSLLNTNNENYYANADKALYIAKQNGRNQVKIYL